MGVPRPQACRQNCGSLAAERPMGELLPDGSARRHCRYPSGHGM